MALLDFASELGAAEDAAYNAYANNHWSDYNSARQNVQRLREANPQVGAFVRKYGGNPLVRQFYAPLFDAWNGGTLDRRIKSGIANGELTEMLAPSREELTNLPMEQITSTLQSMPQSKRVNIYGVMKEQEYVDQLNHADEFGDNILSQLDYRIRQYEAFKGKPTVSQLTDAEQKLGNIKRFAATTDGYQKFSLNNEPTDFKVRNATTGVWEAATMSQLYRGLVSGDQGIKQQINDLYSSLSPEERTKFEKTGLGQFMRRNTMLEPVGVGKSAAVSRDPSTGQLSFGAVEEPGVGNKIATFYGNMWANVRGDAAVAKKAEQHAMALDADALVSLGKARLGIEAVLPGVGQALAMLAESRANSRDNNKWAKKRAAFYHTALESYADVLSRKPRAEWTAADVEGLKKLWNARNEQLRKVGGTSADAVIQDLDTRLSPRASGILANTNQLLTTVPQSGNMSPSKSDLDSFSKPAGQ